VEKYKLKSSQGRIKKKTAGSIRLIPKYSKVVKRTKGKCCKKRYLKFLKIVIQNRKLGGASDEQRNQNVICSKINQPSWDSSIIVKPKKDFKLKTFSKENSYLSVISHNRNSINRSPGETRTSNLQSANHSFSEMNIKTESNKNDNIALSLRNISLMPPSKSKQPTCSSRDNECQRIQLKY
jgi:hypothetical protein